MTDKEKIKQEIERRIKETESMQPKFDQFWAGQISAFKGVIKIIDSLPEESTDEVNCTPENKDLEEEITKCYKSRTDLMMTRRQFGELIHHFTEWQKQQIMNGLK